MTAFSNIVWLATKELRSLLRDFVMIALIVWALGPGLVEWNLSGSPVRYVDRVSGLPRATR